MRVQQPERRRARESFNPSRRRALKRFALVALAAFSGAVMLGASGCASSNKKKESQTIDDVLSAEKPGW